MPTGALMPAALPCSWSCRRVQQGRKGGQRVGEAVLSAQINLRFSLEHFGKGIFSFLCCGAGSDDPWHLAVPLNHSGNCCRTSPHCRCAAAAGTKQSPASTWSTAWLGQEAPQHLYQPRLVFPSPLQPHLGAGSRQGLGQAVELEKGAPWGAGVLVEQPGRSEPENSRLGPAVTR